MRDQFIVDVHLPDDDGNLIKLRSYYEPLTCEITYGCTYFSDEGTWRKASSPDWSMWEKKVWQEIMRSRQAAVCVSMNHCPSNCPNDQHKSKEAYDHPFYEKRKN